MNAEKKKKLCPKCQFVYDANATACPECGTAESVFDQRIENEHYISDDSWEVSDSTKGTPKQREETSAKTLSSKRNLQFSQPSPTPKSAVPSMVGAGYQGRQKDQKFDKTMGVAMLTKPARLDDSPQFVAIEEATSPRHNPVPLATPKEEPKTTFSPLVIALGIASSILIITWFIPDMIIASQAITRMSAVKASQGTALFGLISQPACGALLLAFVIAPLKNSLRALLGLFFGLLVLVAPLMLADLALPLNGKIVLLAAFLATIAGAIAFTKLKSALAGHLTLLVLPLILMGMSFVNGIPIEHLASIKDPITIYAATLAIAASIPHLQKDAK